MISDENNVLLNEVGFISKDTAKDTEQQIYTSQSLKSESKRSPRTWVGSKILIGQPTTPHHLTPPPSFKFKHEGDLSESKSDLIE